MKRVIFAGALLLMGCGSERAACPPAAVTSPTTSTAATAPTTVDASWGPIGALAGNWEGTSDDKKSSGTLSIRAELGGKTLVRRGTNESPQGHHEDLTVISRAPDKTLHADYFDNEGHVIPYVVTASPDGKQIVFVSDGPAAGPKFRLTYNRKTDDDLEILFEMAPPGSSEYRKFNGGVVHRKH